MEYINAILLGIIQGVTEFWPISSSGHLVVGHAFFDLSLSDGLAFDVALHIGTLVAIILFFRKDIARYIVAFFSSLANWNIKTDADQRIAWFIAIGTLPALFVGYLISDLAEDVLRELWIVASMLILFGALLLVSDRYTRQSVNLRSLTWAGAIGIALAQVFAFIPGVSRSGVTITAGLFGHMTRTDAARFSFLLGTPALLGAGGKKMLDLVTADVSSSEWIMIVIGFGASLLVGYAAIAILLKMVQKKPLSVFAYYRFALGAAIFLYLGLSG